MLTKIVMFAAIASCGASSTPATTDKLPPGEQQPADQHFCCQKADHKPITGDGCTAISGSLESINACNQVLYCPGGWTKEDGKVFCD